jgi:DNA segregation ATPase FtsK/SpoIIIE, S-DNA-T family
MFNQQSKLPNPKSRKSLLMATNIPKNPDRTRERKPNKQLSFNFNFKAFSQSEQFKFIVGILFMLITVFLFVAFLSHLFTGNADQSEIANLNPKDKKTANPFGLPFC